MLSKLIHDFFIDHSNLTGHLFKKTRRVIQKNNRSWANVSLRVFQRNICLSAEIFRGICFSSQLENLLLLLGRPCGRSWFSSKWCRDWILLNRVFPYWITLKAKSLIWKRAMETIKRRFPLNKNPGLTNGNEHWLHRPDPSQVASAYCTFKQATKKRL